MIPGERGVRLKKKKKMNGSQLTSHDDRDLLLELISHRLRQKKKKKTNNERALWPQAFCIFSERGSTGSNQSSV